MLGVNIDRTTRRQIREEMAEFLNEWRQHRMAEQLELCTQIHYAHQEMLQRQFNLITIGLAYQLQPQQSFPVSGHRSRSGAARAEGGARVDDHYPGGG